MAKNKPADEPVVGVFVGVDEQYANAANDYDLPYQAPGESEPVFTPGPEALFVTKDPEYGLRPDYVEPEDEKDDEPEEVAAPSAPSVPPASPVQ